MDNKEYKSIAVDYKLYVIENGEKSLQEETSAGNPFRFLSGFGMTIPGFENAIAPLAVGDTFDFTLSKDDAYGDACDAVLGASLRLPLLLEPIVVELSAVASQALGRGIGIERVFQVVETVELHFCAVGLRVPQALIEAAPGMHLVGHVAHFLKDLCRLAVVRHRLCLPFLAEQSHAHLVVGNGQ